MPRDQVADAKDLYDDRASKYDDSHHPRFARHMLELAKPTLGENVLDLACGTGLVSFPASTAVGAEGTVIGVDISSGMLAQASRRQNNHEPKNVNFYLHSITDLESLAELRDQKFDLITCCSALVLLEDPEVALRKWVAYLKPGGRLIVDVTHPQNLTPGILIEKVGRVLGHPLPWYRLNFQNPTDLSSRMKAAGLSDVEITFLAQQTIAGTEKMEDYVMDLDAPKIFREHDVDDVDQIFEEQINSTAAKGLAHPPERREKAKAVFRDEWKKFATKEGKVQEIDGVFVGIGWKRD